MPQPELYGTKEVAALLEVEQWRVTNFTEGAAYGLSPSMTVGKGHGSRKFYALVDVLRMALANRLVQAGFTPESVGEAIAKTPNTTFMRYTVEVKPSVLDTPPKSPPVLVNVGGKWRLDNQDGATKASRDAIDRVVSDKGVFIINVANVCIAILERLKHTAQREGE